MTTWGRARNRKDKIRFDHKSDQSDAERFLASVGRLDDCVLKDFQPVTDKCHIIRYKYLWGAEKVGILYDTKARLLSVTAPEPQLGKLKALLPGPVSDGSASSGKPVGQETGERCPVTEGDGHTATVQTPPVPAKGRKRQPQTSGEPNGAPVQNSAKKPAGKSAPAKKQVQNKPPETARQQTGRSIAVAEATPADPQPPDKSGLVKSKQPKTAPKGPKQAVSAQAKKNDKAAKVPAAEEPSEVGGQDYTVKKFAPEQLDGVLKGSKKLGGVTYRLEDTTAAGTPNETRIYCIKNAGGVKVKLRYMPVKKILQLQGKRSNLYGEVQALIAGDTDFVSAVKPHIELTGDGMRTGELQKMLKKRLPDAFEYLSEQSKIDLTIGLIDIYNNEIRLTDYSSLLTPPYRGLEKFVSDLQKAQGIEVKMIGQAFDKQDGKYVLKSGYVRRIRSVVYAEVLAALYAEYFARRNFYTHSDNSEESAPRMIGDKAEVVAIFERLLDTINYNSKKLKEIGFSL